MSDQKVYVFIDDSNIFISAKEAVSRREGIAERGMARLQFDNLAKLAIANRIVGKVVVVGSIPPEEKQVWDRMEKAMGVKPELYERGGESGGEQGIDQCLQVHMLRAISDNTESPQIAVLLTGDGAGFDDGIGFHADLKRMREAGWGIEVISWTFSCKKTLREWANREGVFIPLENYYESITYIKDGRISKYLDISARPMAKISKTPAQFAEEKVRKEMEEKIRELEQQLHKEKEKNIKKDKKKKHYEKKIKK